MKTKDELVKMIEWRKKEVSYNGLNILDLSASDYEGVASLEDICMALKSCMLEGDHALEGNAEIVSADLKVRYYCDNLSEDRKRIYA